MFELKSGKQQLELLFVLYLFIVYSTCAVIFNTAVVVECDRYSPRSR